VMENQLCFVDSIPSKDSTFDGPMSESMILCQYDKRMHGSIKSKILITSCDSEGTELFDRDLTTLDLSFQIDDDDSKEIESFSCLDYKLLPKCDYQMIRVLILRNNRLTSLANMHLTEMSCLTDLDLGYNSISGSIPVGVFPPCLQRLDLSGNYIDGIEGLICCLSLQSLDVSVNSLRAISTLPPRLLELDISHNNLTSLNNLRLLSMSPNMISLNIVGNPAVEPYAKFRGTVCPLLLKLEKLDGVLLPGYKLRKNRAIGTKAAEQELIRKAALNKKQQEEADIQRHEEYDRRQIEVKEKRARINENIDLLVRSPRHCSSSPKNNSSPYQSPSSTTYSSPPSASSGTDYSPEKQIRNEVKNVPRITGFGALLQKHQEASDLNNSQNMTSPIRRKNFDDIDVSARSPRSNASSPSRREQEEGDIHRHVEYKRRQADAAEKLNKKNEEIDILINSPRSRSTSPTRQQQKEYDASRHDLHLKHQLEVIIKREEVYENIDNMCNSPRNKARSPLSKELQLKTDKDRAESYLKKEILVQQCLEELQSITGQSQFTHGLSTKRIDNKESTKSVSSKLTASSTSTSTTLTTASQKCKNRPTSDLIIKTSAVTTASPSSSQLSVTPATAPSTAHAQKGSRNFSDVLQRSPPQSLKDRKTDLGSRSGIIKNAMNLVNKGGNINAVNSSSNGHNSSSGKAVSVSAGKKSDTSTGAGSYVGSSQRDLGSYTDNGHTTASQSHSHSQSQSHAQYQSHLQAVVPSLESRSKNSNSNSNSNNNSTSNSNGNSNNSGRVRNTHTDRQNSMKSTDGQCSIDMSSRNRAHTDKDSDKNRDRDRAVISDDMTVVTVGDSITEDGLYCVGETVIREVEATIQRNNDILLKIVNQIRLSMAKEIKDTNKNVMKRRSRAAVTEILNDPQNSLSSPNSAFLRSNISLPFSSPALGNQFLLEENKIINTGSREMKKELKELKSSNITEKKNGRKQGIQTIDERKINEKKNVIDREIDNINSSKNISSNKNSNEYNNEKEEHLMQVDISMVTHTPSLTAASVGSWTSDASLIPQPRPQVTHTLPHYTSILFDII
jgi:hypothetical protein